MDYSTRRCGVDFCFMPSGDINNDMKILMDFYRDKSGKHPERFALDERYSGQLNRPLFKRITV